MDGENASATLNVWQATITPEELTVQSTFDKLIDRAISPSTVRPKGPLTEPRTYGVYELPLAAGATRRYRMGNHPIRMIELEQEFKGCKLLYLFRSRPDAVLLANHFNK